MTNDAHAIYSPSSAYRNFQCKGAIAWIKHTNSKSKVSVYAEEGTLFHEHIKNATEALLEKSEFELSDISDKEMREHVIKYIEEINKVVNSFAKTHHGIKFHIEKRITYNRDFWGTGDLIITGWHKENKKILDAIIIDAKYGKGVEVEAEDNEQLMAYVVCAQKELGVLFDRVFAFIYQPRTPGEAFSRWVVDRKTILAAERGYVVNQEECLRLIDKSEETILKELVPGDHCRFCPAKQENKCPKYLENLNASQLKVLDNVPEVPVIKELTIEQKVEIFKRRKMIKNFMDEIASELLILANSGTKVPGHKIVEGKRSRKWRSDKDMHEIGRKLIHKGATDPFIEKLKGITEIEKEIGKGKIEDLVELSKPGYQLVPDEDKRNGIQSIALQDLEDIEL